MSVCHFTKIHFGKVSFRKIFCVISQKFISQKFHFGKVSFRKILINNKYIYIYKIKNKKK